LKKRTAFILRVMSEFTDRTPEDEGGTFVRNLKKQLSPTWRNPEDLLAQYEDRFVTSKIF
jgi:hypothetical protein